MCECIGSGLMSMNIIQEVSEWRDYKLKIVGIYSHSSQYFLMIDLTAIIYGLTTVPIYDTLGEEATEFIFEQTKMNVLFLTNKHFAKMQQVVKEKQGLVNLRLFVIMDAEQMDI